MGSLSPLFFLPLVFAISDPDHPVLGGILERYEGKPASTDCAQVLSEEFRSIAALENMESALILKDLKAGGCRLDFLAVGGRGFVNRDLELYNRLLADPEASSAIDFHVHPLLNVDYFRAGSPYKGEIMFASPEAIREAQLSAEKFDQLVALVQTGRLHGFNLSPPSTQDMLASTASSPIPLQYAVATSAGIWVYSMSGERTPSQIRDGIGDFTIYSYMYEIMNSEDPAVKPEKKARAKRLFEANMEEPEKRRIFQEWQACSIGLRRPYSQEALDGVVSGDFSKADAEWAKKLELAQRWSALMKEIGMQMEFRPFL